MVPRLAGPRLLIAVAALVGPLVLGEAHATSPREDPAVPDPEVITPAPTPSFGTELEAAVARFGPVYAKRGSPRIAIYWNREVTDRRSDWRTDRRSVEVTRRNDVSRSNHQHVMKFEQTPARDRERLTLEDGWLWEFQDGFLYPLLRSRVQVVDRAAIQRLTAVGVGSSTAEALDGPALEMRSLQRYASLWVEVLMTPAEESPTGVELAVTVKDVMTGAIVAYTTSAQLADAEQAPRYVATSRGFERRSPPPPSPRQLGARLAMNLMDALTRQWSL